MAWNGTDKVGYLPSGICAKLVSQFTCVPVMEAVQMDIQAPFMDREQLKLTGKCNKLEVPAGRSASTLSELPISISLFGPFSIKTNPELAFLFPQAKKAAAIMKGKLKPHEIDNEDELDEGWLAEQAKLAAESRRKHQANDVFDTFFGESSSDLALLQECNQPPNTGPHSVATSLLKHQLQALRWMVEMEHPRPRSSPSSLQTLACQKLRCTMMISERRREASPALDTRARQRWRKLRQSRNTGMPVRDAS